MAIILKQKEYEGTFFDNISGEKVTLIYRRASTKEKNKFRSAVANLIMKYNDSKDRDDFVDEHNELQEEWGNKVLIGLGENDFYLDEDSEEPISTNEDFDNYYSGWRAVIKEERPELLRALCSLVFSDVRHLANTEKKRVLPNNLDITTELN